MPPRMTVVLLRRVVSLAPSLVFPVSVTVLYHRTYATVPLSLHSDRTWCLRSAHTPVITIKMFVNHDFSSRWKVLNC
jgi:hypothetical protein